MDDKEPVFKLYDGTTITQQGLPEHTLEVNVPEPVTFEVGDIVDWCGARGTVTGTEGGTFPVRVEFASKPDLVFSFTSDGRSLTWHTEPSLKLVEKAKKKVKKKFWTYKLFSPSHEGMIEIPDDDSLKEIVKATAILQALQANDSISIKEVEIEVDE